MTITSVRFRSSLQDCSAPRTLHGDRPNCEAQFCAQWPRLAKKDAELSHPPETKERRRRRRARRAPEGYRTISELAAAGDIARSSLYRYAKSGELPVSEWRGRIVVADAAFDAFVAVTPRAAGGDIND